MIYYVIRSTPAHHAHPLYFRLSGETTTTRNVDMAHRYGSPITIPPQARDFWEVVAVLDDGTEIPLTEG